MNLTAFLTPALCFYSPSLDELEKDQSYQNKAMFFGYFSAFVSCIYGHRTGVLTNMTVEEVIDAKKKSKSPGEGYVINVSHKTHLAVALIAVLKPVSSIAGSCPQD